MKITNTGRGTRLINAQIDGKLRQVPILPGQSFEGDVVETKSLAGAVERGVLKVGGSPAPKRGVTYEVAEKGNGWFVVTQDGSEVTKSLRKDDLAGFADMPEADKAAFVELHKAD